MRAADIGEIAAKGGAVGTVSGLLGLILSLLFARVAAAAPPLTPTAPATAYAWRAGRAAVAQGRAASTVATALASALRAGVAEPWAWFWALTGVHLWACRAGLRLLALNTLTVPTLATLVQAAAAPADAAPADAAAAAQTWDLAAGAEGSTEGRPMRLPTPSQVAATARVVAFPAHFKRITLGASWADAVAAAESVDAAAAAACSAAAATAPDRPALGPAPSSAVAGLAAAVALFEGEPFVVVASASTAPARQAGRGRALVFLKRGAGPADELRAATCACLLLRRMDACAAGDSGARAGAAPRGLEAQALRDLGSFYPRFLEALDGAGWNREPDHLHLVAAPWRISVSP